MSIPSQAIALGAAPNQAVAQGQYAHEVAERHFEAQVAREPSELRTDGGDARLPPSPERLKSWEWFHLHYSELFSSYRESS